MKFKIKETTNKNYPVIQGEGESFQVRRDVAELLLMAPELYEFVKQFADMPCDELPGEYPQVGEFGQAPCYPCQAKKIFKVKI